MYFLSTYSELELPPKIVRVLDGRLDSGGSRWSLPTTVIA
jgi:hypothetical protein